MLEALTQFYKQFSFLGVKEVAQLVGLARLKSFKQGEVLVEAGALNYNFFIVLKGLLRNYLVKSNGEERTVLFSPEGTVSGSPRPFFHDEPTNETIVALEDTWVAVVDIRSFRDLASTSLNLQKLYSENLKRNLSDAIDRLEFHTAMNSEERYAHYQEHFPDLIQRVPQVHLASFLGITPVSLSRVRSRLAKKK